jgi:hypothetical protein
MPFENQHAARIKDPEQFKYFRTVKRDVWPDGITAIMGWSKDDMSDMSYQAFRADSSKISFDEFKQWLDTNIEAKILEITEATESDNESDKEEVIELSLFTNWSEIQLVKSIDEQQCEDDDEGIIYVGGIASAETTDHSGEIILQDGLDWEYFLKEGFFNWEHHQGPENILGAPTKIQKMFLEDGTKATYVEGKLLTTTEKSKSVIETIKALEQAKSLNRKIGFSIEGVIQSRDVKNPKIVTKAKILNVSVTAHPCNRTAELELLTRSVMSSLQKDSVAYQEPAQPADAGISNLVPQSLENDVASATFGTKDKKTRRKRTNKKENLDAGIDISNKDVVQGEIYQEPTTNDTRQVMISLQQLRKLISKIFSMDNEHSLKLAMKLLNMCKNK